MPIESRKNSVLKDIRRLKSCKGDRAVLEGPHLLREALASGIEIETVLATPETIAREPEVFRGLPRPPLEITLSALESVTDSDSPRGVLAVARLPRVRIESLPAHRQGVYVFLDVLQDPGNLGAVARAAEATGASALVLSPGCCHPNHPRALRASAGSLLRLPTAVGVAATDLRQRLAEIGPTWVALTPRGDEELHAASLAPPMVLVIGGERGLDAELSSWCDRHLRIAMSGEVESLNAAVATALALFEIRRQTLR